MINPFWRLLLYFLCTLSPLLVDCFLTTFPISTVRLFPSFFSQLRPFLTISVFRGQSLILKNLCIYFYQKKIVNIFDSFYIMSCVNDTIPETERWFKPFLLSIYTSIGLMFVVPLPLPVWYSTQDIGMYSFIAKN